MKKRFFAPVDLALIAGIVVCSLGGVAYAALSGVVVIPGIEPFLAADVEPTPTIPPVQVGKTTPSPRVSVTVSSSPSSSPTVSPTVSPSTSTSPSPKLSPTPSPSPSPSPSPVASPSPTAKQYDATGKEKAAEIQVALEAYYKKFKKYPVSATYNDGRTDNPKTALTALVDQGYLKELPVPHDTPTYWYGYKSDGKLYYITVRLRDTTDASGAYDEEGNYLYTVTNATTGS